MSIPCTWTVCVHVHVHVHVHVLMSMSMPSMFMSYVHVVKSHGGGGDVTVETPVRGVGV